MNALQLALHAEPYIGIEAKAMCNAHILNCVNCFRFQVHSLLQKVAFTHIHTTQHTNANFAFSGIGARCKKK